MLRGYLETRESWIAWPQYVNAANQEERDETLAYLRYCRDLALTFDRHGAARSRDILEALPAHRRLTGDWNQRIIYNSWFDARNARENGRRWVAGWVSQSWEQALVDRPARIELLSLDGREDVLYELTEFDTEYVPIFGPQLGPVQHLDTGFRLQTRPADGHPNGEQHLNEASDTTALHQANNVSPENNTSLKVKTEMLAELDVATNRATTSGAVLNGNRNRPTSSNEETEGPELYDPAHPTTEAEVTNATAQPSVDDLPPLLSAMVFRGPALK
jgi:hypothetical protein